MIIRSAAFFQVCENCGLHGRIVLSDGTPSREVPFIQNALKDMEECFKRRKISQIELPELRRQIQSSSLSYMPQEAENIIRCQELLDLLSGDENLGLPAEESEEEIGTEIAN